MVVGAPGTWLGRGAIDQALGLPIMSWALLACVAFGIMLIPAGHHPPAIKHVQTAFNGSVKRTIRIHPREKAVGGFGACAEIRKKNLEVVDSARGTQEPPILSYPLRMTFDNKVTPSAVQVNVHCFEVKVSRLGLGWRQAFRIYILLSGRGRDDQRCMPDIALQGLCATSFRILSRSKSHMLWSKESQGFTWSVDELAGLDVVDSNLHFHKGGCQ